MGTRGIVVVVKDKEYKIARYNHFDSYPEGLGNELFRFIRSIKEKGQWELFEERLKRTERLRDNEGEFEKEDSLSVMKEADFRGMTIFKILLENDWPRYVFPDDLEFAGSSLFCEWGYVIDCDNEQVEIYRGFNKSLPDGQRFSFLTDELDEFKPIRHIKTYSLDELPSIKQLNTLVDEARGE